FADNDTFEFAFSSVVEHDHRMVQARIDLLFAHGFDPFAVGHKSGCLGCRHTALVYAHTHTRGNVNPSPRGIELCILPPFTEAGATRLDGGFHPDDAANLLWEY